MKLPRKALASPLAALAAAFFIAACGGGDKGGKGLDDSNPDNPGFHVAADGTRFGGAAPLTVQFYGTPFHETGKVHWRWRFDDGATSEEQNPTHTFKVPGYYQVLMEARDVRGQDAWNLIVGVWPPALWEAREKGNGPQVDTTTIHKLQRVQNRRTAKRRLELMAKSRARAAKYSSGSENPAL